MTNNSILLIIVLLIFSVGCSSHNDTPNSKTHRIEYSNNGQRITGTQILKDDLAALSIYTIDTLLLTKQTESDTVFKVYSLPDLNYLGFLGKIGNGPNEFTAPRYADDYVIEKGKIFMWIHDARKLRFRKVNVLASLNKQTCIVEEELYIHPSYGLSQFLFHINDSTVIGNTGYESLEKIRLRKLDVKNDSVLTDSHIFPEIKSQKKLRPAEAYTLFFDRLKLSKKKGLFVSAMQKFDRIDLFNKDLHHLKTINFGDASLSLDLEDYKNKPMFQYYKDLLLTENHILALYCKVELKVDMPSLPSDIRVFDWNGDLLETIKVADDLISMAIDEKNKHLYGVDFENEKILRYNLPENLIFNN